MEFINQTPFSALAYTAIDVQDREYRVVAMAVAYRLEPDPTQAGQWSLRVIDEESPPLCLADEYFGPVNESSVRRESDLCPFKPKCDILVSGSAHAPGGQAQRRFQVRLVVRRADRQAPLPERPQPLNPRMPLTVAQESAWQKELEASRGRILAGETLVDKTLNIHGPRFLKRRAFPVRLLQELLRWGSLGLLDPNPWRLTRAERISQLPLRYEYSYGGQCRINQRDNRHLPGDPAALQDDPGPARRVGKQYRLTAEELAGHPDAAAPAARQAVAHGCCEANPLGQGYARKWYLKAARIKQLAAPQIESPQTPFSAGSFWRSLSDRKTGSPEPAGLGPVGRAWQPRRARAGTYDENWKSRRWPLLPEDFDFGYWNCAPADQQTAYLEGDEHLFLENLVAPDSPGSLRDEEGNTSVRLKLPGHRVFVLARFENGGLYPLRSVIDTLHLELEHPEGPRLTCLWRSLVPSALPLAVLEGRFEMDPSAPLLKFESKEAA